MSTRDFASQTLLLQIGAATCYAIGGAFMKASHGMTSARSTVMLFGLFAVAICLQALSMKHTTMGTAYIVVLGLEALVAIVISIAWFRETYGLREGLGVLLILAGVALLRATTTTP